MIIDTTTARERIEQRVAATRTTETFHVSYAGYDSARLVVRLDDDLRPIEVMFFIGPCLRDVKRRVENLALNCQLISTALRHGTPLESLAAACVRRLPLELAVHRYYGSTPAPVANNDTEWMLRHLALTYLGEQVCSEVGIHPGFWCPACDKAAARSAGHSFFCNCGWSYIN